MHTHYRLVVLWEWKCSDQYHIKRQSLRYEMWWVVNIQENISTIVCLYVYPGFVNISNIDTKFYAYCKNINHISTDKDLTDSTIDIFYCQGHFLEWWVHSKFCSKVQSRPFLITCIKSEMKEKDISNIFYFRSWKAVMVNAEGNIY